MMAHVADAVKQGSFPIITRSVDTDVLMLAIFCAKQLSDLNELWLRLDQFIAFRRITTTGKLIGEK